MNTDTESTKFVKGAKFTYDTRSEALIPQPTDTPEDFQYAGDLEAEVEAAQGADQRMERMNALFKKMDMLNARSTPEALKGLSPIKQKMIKKKSKKIMNRIINGKY